MEGKETKIVTHSVVAAAAAQGALHVEESVRRADALPGRGPKYEEEPEARIQRSRYKRNDSQFKKIERNQTDKRTFLTDSLFLKKETERIFACFLQKRKFWSFVHTH